MAWQGREPGKLLSPHGCIAKDINRTSAEDRCHRYPGVLHLVDRSSAAGRGMAVAAAVDPHRRSSNCGRNCAIVGPDLAGQLGLRPVDQCFDGNARRPGSLDAVWLQLPTAVVVDPHRLQRDHRESRSVSAPDRRATHRCGSANRVPAHQARILAGGSGLLGLPNRHCDKRPAPAGGGHRGGTHVGRDDSAWSRTGAPNHRRGLGGGWLFFWGSPCHSSPCSCSCRSGWQCARGHGGLASSGLGQRLRCSGSSSRLPFSCTPHKW